ncbi:MAG: AI-2E family transporter [Pleurocapsa minor GSE-CHR-MK-17-07R]|jgi:predicted PurR-regulated permease PerM|nr:AI-2E family transporter [Pleurocapsa minor GSE-CHR-MK 17-07R]
MSTTPEKPPVTTPSSVAAAAASKKQPAGTQSARAQQSEVRRRAALERDEDYQPQWDRLTRLMVSVGLVVALVYMLTLISPILQMIIVALLIAFVMFFFARAVMSRTRLPWAASVVVVYLVLLIGIFGGIGGLVPPIVQGINSASDGLQDLYGQLRETLNDYEAEDGMVAVLGTTIDLNPFILQIRQFVLGASDPDGVTTAAVIEITPEPEGQTDTTTTVVTETTVTQTPATGNSSSVNPLQGLDLQSILGQVTNLFGTLTGALGSVTSFVGSLLLAVFISFLLMLDLPRTNRSIADWIPSNYHREATVLIDRIEKIWVGFLRGQVIIGVIIGVVTFIQLTVMGVQSALLLSIIVALISLIPTIGGIIALVPLFLVPLLQGSSVFLDMPNGTFALIVVGVNLVISQVVWNAIAPKILGDALNLPVVVIIVGVFVGTAVGGALGAFLVAPIMSTLWLFVNYLVRKIAQKDPFPGEMPERQLGRAEFAETHEEEEDDSRMGVPHPAPTIPPVPGATSAGIGELK